MWLDFLLYDRNDRFLGFPVSCRALDDGQFEPTAEALQALTTASGRVELRYSRGARSLSFIDGVAVFVFNEVSDQQGP